MIETVLGALPAAQLGATSMHEHLLADASALAIPPISNTSCTSFSILLIGRDGERGGVGEQVLVHRGGAELRRRQRPEDGLDHGVGGLPAPAQRRVVFDGSSSATATTATAGWRRAS